MVTDTIGVLALPQREINRQFYKMLMEAEAGDASAIQALADKIGSETTANTILKRIKDIETGIGKASGDGAGGILKDIADLKSAVGDADSGLVKSVNGIIAAIGAENEPGTILARLKTLEDG